MEDDHAVGWDGDRGGTGGVKILTESIGGPFEASPSRIDLPRHVAREPVRSSEGVGLQVRPGGEIVVEPRPRIDVCVIRIRADEVPAVGVRARSGVGRPLEVESCRQVFTVDAGGGSRRHVLLAVLDHDVGRDRDRRSRLLDDVLDRPRHVPVIRVRTRERPQVVVHPGIDVCRRDIEAQAIREIFSMYSCDGPDGDVGLSVVRRDVGRHLDRGSGLIHGERAGTERLIVLIRADKLPCHRMNTGVPVDFMGDGGSEELTIDAIGVHDPLLPTSVEDHGVGTLSPGLGPVDRALHPLDEKLVVVSEGTLESQAGNDHRLAEARVRIGVDAGRPLRDEDRRRIGREETDEVRLADIQHGIRGAVEGTGIGGDAADLERHEHTREDDVVAVPAGVADPEGLPVAGEEYRAFGQFGKGSVDRDVGVVDENGHRLADRGAALDRDLESGAPETRGIIGCQHVRGRRIPRSGKHHLRPIDRRRLEHDAPNMEAPRNVAADDQRFLIPDLSAPREVVGEEIEGTGVDEPVDDQVPFPGSRWDRARRTLAEDRSVVGTADNDGVAGVGVGAGEREHAGTGLPQRAAGTYERRSVGDVLAIGVDTVGLIGSRGETAGIVGRVACGILERAAAEADRAGGAESPRTPQREHAAVDGRAAGVGVHAGEGDGAGPGLRQGARAGEVRRDGAVLQVVARSLEAGKVHRDSVDSRRLVTRDCNAAELQRVRSCGEIHRLRDVVAPCSGGERGRRPG